MNEAITYTTIERIIEIFGKLTETQFQRCCALRHELPGRRHKEWAEHYVFFLRDDADLMALQDYVVELGLPHRITTTREWKP